MKFRQAKTPLLEALVRHHKPAMLPRENLHPVAALRHEDKKMPGEKIFFPLIPNNRTQPINRIAHVDGLR